jgi:hypothetical protein
MWVAGPKVARSLGFPTELCNLAKNPARHNEPHIGHRLLDASQKNAFDSHQGKQDAFSLSLDKIE